MRSFTEVVAARGSRGRQQPPSRRASAAAALVQSSSRIPRLQRSPYPKRAITLTKASSPRARSPPAGRSLELSSIQATSCPSAVSTRTSGLAPAPGVVHAEPQPLTVLALLRALPAPERPSDHRRRLPTLLEKGLHGGSTNVVDPVALVERAPSRDSSFGSSLPPNAAGGHHVSVGDTTLGYLEPAGPAAGGPQKVRKTSAGDQRVPTAPQGIRAGQTQLTNFVNANHLSERSSC